MSESKIDWTAIQNAVIGAFIPLRRRKKRTRCYTLGGRDGSARMTVDGTSASFSAPVYVVKHVLDSGK